MITHGGVTMKINATTANGFQLVASEGGIPQSQERASSHPRCAPNFAQLHSGGVCVCGCSGLGSNRCPRTLHALGGAEGALLGARGPCSCSRSGPPTMQPRSPAASCTHRVGLPRRPGRGGGPVGTGGGGRSAEDREARSPLGRPHPLPGSLSPGADRPDKGHSPAVGLHRGGGRARPRAGGAAERGGGRRASGPAADAALEAASPAP